MSSSTSTWADTDPGTGTKFYRIAAVKPDACTPTDNTKAGAGPYRHALSNLDDNRLRDTRVADFLSSGVLTVYPNPVSDRATIKFPNPDHETYQLILTDFSGKIIRLIEDISDDTIELTRDGLSAGLYLVELRGPKILRAKILIE